MKINTLFLGVLFFFLCQAGKAQTFYQDGFWCEINENDRYSVTLLGIENKTFKSPYFLIIPDEITHSGVTFKVERIARFSRRDTYSTDYYWPKKVNKIKFGRNVKVIESNIFINCEKLQTIEFTNNESVIILGDRAFEDCEELSVIKNSRFIKKYGSGCFSGCEKLENIDLGEGVSFGLYPFEYSGLKEITFPEGLENISLERCRYLQKMVLPMSLKTISSLQGLPSLKRIILKCSTPPLYFNMTTLF